MTDEDDKTQHAGGMQRDLKAISAVIDEMYDMISGPAGPRDWSRLANCFLPEARQVRTFVDDSETQYRLGDGTVCYGRPGMLAMGPEEYRENVTPFFMANPFYEVETSRRIDLFGNMAHVWSSYEARTSPDDVTPERRGINSIQLFRHPDLGWRIISMIWDNHRE